MEARGSGYELVTNLGQLRDVLSYTKIHWRVRYELELEVLILDIYVLIILRYIHALRVFSLFVKVLLNPHRVILVGLTLNFLQKFLLVSVELQVLEHLILIILSLRFMKIVHIELPHKRGVIVMFEIFRKDFFLQFGLVYHHK